MVCQVLSVQSLQTSLAPWDCFAVLPCIDSITMHSLFGERPVLQVVNLGRIQSLDWNSGMERWNGTVEWNDLSKI